MDSAPRPTFDSLMTITSDIGDDARTEFGSKENVNSKWNDGGGDVEDFWAKTSCCYLVIMDPPPFPTAGLIPSGIGDDGDTGFVSKENVNSDWEYGGDKVEDFVAVTKCFIPCTIESVFSILLLHSNSS